MPTRQPGCQPDSQDANHSLLLMSTVFFFQGMTWKMLRCYICGLPFAHLMNEQIHYIRKIQRHHKDLAKSSTTQCQCWVIHFGRRETEATMMMMVMMMIPKKHTTTPTKTSPTGSQNPYRFSLFSVRIGRVEAVETR